MRLKYIDSAKGFAMLLIVWGHTVTFSDPIAEWALGFKITLFYIVTGLLLGIRSAEDCCVKKAPLKKLILSMGVPYAFYSLLSFIAAVVMFFAEGQPVDFLLEKLMRIFTLGGISTLWFLPSIFIGRVLFESVYCKKQTVIQRALRICVTLVFIVGAALAYNAAGARDNYSLISMLLLVIFKGLVAFWFIAVGFEAGKLKEKLRLKNAARGFYVFVLLALSVVFSLLNKGIDFNNGSLGSQPLLFFVTGLCGCLGIIEFFEIICGKISCHFLEFVGKNSLFVMTTHLPLYIVPIVFTVVSGVFKAEGTAFDYIRAIITFVTVLIIEWVLIIVKNKLTAKVKNEHIRKFLGYI